MKSFYYGRAAGARGPYAPEALDQRFLGGPSPLNFTVRCPVRLWTLHPKYLDAKGLVALWREGLLARAVLKGGTTGYRHHPQLERFRAHACRLAAINAYLREVAIEAEKRGYSFDRQKIGPCRRGVALQATRGQLGYEWNHLLGKLRMRSPELYARLRGNAHPESHPLFEIVLGGVESWERQQFGAPNNRCRGL